MDKINFIDFGTVEIPTDFIIILDEGNLDISDIFYIQLKRKLKRYVGTNDFERWFCLNLEINDSFLRGWLSFDECLSLAYLLKKVEESNQDLQKTIRIWRQDESKLPQIHRFYINNILIVYYQLFFDNYHNQYYKFNPSDMLNKFISEFNPRLLKKSSDFGRIRSDFGRIRKENYDEFIEELRKRTRFNEFHKLYGRKYNLFEWETNIFYFYVSIDEDGLLQYFFVE